MARKLSTRKGALPEFLGNRLAAMTSQHQLNMQMQHQEQTQWCWCAVSVSVSHYFDAASTWTQCAMANAQLGQATCCQDGGSDQCNQPGRLDTALTQTGNLDHTQGGTIAAADIESEINANRPISCWIVWSDGGAHFISVDGYTTQTSGDDMLSVKDPWYGPTPTPYSTLVNGYQGRGTWSQTYYQKAAS
jgi:Papain-like cysteine protease AvrRpt2